MGKWQLADCMNPVEKMEDTPVIAIQSEEQLREELNRMRARKPGIVFLLSPENERLELGIGGPFAGIRWMKPPSEKFFKEAVADRIYSPEPIEFSAEGSDTPFFPEHLFPVEEIIEAAAYFFNHHRLPGWITWSEWNPATKKWDIVPGIPRPPMRQRTQAPEAEVKT
jgi:hypothetical protein